jgi:hypothetical protein
VHCTSRVLVRRTRFSAPWTHSSVAALHGQPCRAACTKQPPPLCLPAAFFKGPGGALVPPGHPRCSPALRCLLPCSLLRTESTRKSDCTAFQSRILRRVKKHCRPAPHSPHTKSFHSSDLIVLRECALRLPPGLIKAALWRSGGPASSPRLPLCVCSLSAQLLPANTHTPFFAHLAACEPKILHAINCPASLLLAHAVNKPSHPLQQLPARHVSTVPPSATLAGCQPGG